MAGYQPLLPFGPVRNSGLFSNHWLEHRLPLEPPWAELRRDAAAALDHLDRLWQRARPRVEHYRDEHTLEEKFIQPVFEGLGQLARLYSHITWMRFWGAGQ